MSKHVRRDEHVHGRVVRGASRRPSSPFSSSNAWNLQIIKSEFKEHFRNVSRIMDCVGCDKCRLWGKLQVTGLGTALKLLFSTDSTSPPTSPPLLISRGELVSFVNVLHRLSESLAAIERFRTLWKQRDAVATPNLFPPSIAERSSSVAEPVPQSHPPQSAFNSLLPKNPRVGGIGKPSDEEPEKSTPHRSPVPRTSATLGSQGLDEARERAGVFSWLARLSRHGVSSWLEAFAKFGMKARGEL